RRPLQRPGGAAGVDRSRAEAARGVRAPWRAAGRGGDSVSPRASGGANRGRGRQVARGNSRLGPHVRGRDPFRAVGGAQVGAAPGGTHADTRVIARVDAHHHFWDPARRDYPWLGPGLAALRPPFGPEDLKPLLAASGIDRTILVQTVGTLEEAREFLEIAAAN